LGYRGVSPDDHAEPSPWIDEDGVATTLGSTSAVNHGWYSTLFENHFSNALQSLIFKPPVYGAYSELYAGFSPEVKLDHNGGHLMAWGRKTDLPDDIKKGLKSVADGGNAAAQKFFEYCDREIKTFL